MLEADWIVVGGGSAGAVMAARLSEDGAASAPDLDVHPVIDQNQLSERSDLVRLRDGIRRALELLETPAFNEVVDLSDLIRTAPRGEA